MDSSTVIRMSEPMNMLFRPCGLMRMVTRKRSAASAKATAAVFFRKADRAPPRLGGRRIISGADNFFTPFQSPHQAFPEHLALLPGGEDGHQQAQQQDHVADQVLP